MTSGITSCSYEVKSCDTLYVNICKYVRDNNIRKAAHETYVSIYTSKVKLLSMLLLYKLTELAVVTETVAEDDISKRQRKVAPRN
jgi:hypothetical protein